MDEPFAALDAQTREILQGELVSLWERTGKTVVFVTHSIDEAIFLSQRVAVMTARPGRIKEIVDIELPSPRYAQDVRSAPEFAKVRQTLSRLLAEEVDKAAAEAYSLTEKAEKPGPAAPASCPGSPQRGSRMTMRVFVLRLLIIAAFLALWEGCPALALSMRISSPRCRLSPKISGP